MTDDAVGGGLGAGATAGDDEGGFAALAERHRRQLQVHCYRMVGSFDESEDLVQETFLRAWRGRRGFEGRSSFGTWLHRIATNVCLDRLAREPGRAQAKEAGSGAPSAEIPWLQPFPDPLLDEAASEPGPEAVLVRRETIELAFLAAIQHLPPRQRAVLILRDVLDWSAAEAGSLLDSSVASVNSALQRARATLARHLPERGADWIPETEPSDQERDLLRRYVEATERADMDAFAATLREDVLFSMPPQPEWYAGRDALIELFGPAMTGPTAMGEFRLVQTRANRQPAFANYVRKPGESQFGALALDVLRIEGGEVAEIVTFGSAVFAAFGLPPVL